MTRSRWVQPAPTGEFADILRLMHKINDPRLNATLKTAVDAGWHLRALGDVLGTSRQSIEYRTLRAEFIPHTALPDIPQPPRRPVKQPSPPPPRLTVDAELAAQLRAMHETAKTVNGGMATWHPARRVSEALTAQLASLVAQGVSQYHLAQVLGVTYQAVHFRLGRHGYSSLPPSRPHTYRNRKIGDPDRVVAA